MAVITDPDNLSQGTVTTVSDLTFASTLGVGTTITSAGGNLPTGLLQNDYIEVRSARLEQNNGLYKITDASPSVNSFTADKVGGLTNGDPTDDPTTTSTNLLHTNASTADEKSVYFDTYDRKVWLIKQGNLSDDGVYLQALYSFAKEEWKADDYLIKFDFPFIAITPEQFEITQGWQWWDDTITPAGETGRTTRQLIRRSGWEEVNPDGSTTDKIYTGVITLGTFQAGTDNAYYRLGTNPSTTADTQNFVFTGPVDEGVLIYDYNFGNTSLFANGVSTGNTFADGDLNFTGAAQITRAAGSWIDQGYAIGGKIRVITGTNASTSSYTISGLTATVLDVSGSPSWTTGVENNASFAADNRLTLDLFLRENDGSYSKAFAASDLAAIGLATTGVTSQAYRFPLTNSLDTDVTASGLTDAIIASNTYAQDVRIQYFDAGTPYNKAVDTPGTTRPFSIVIDNGTFSFSTANNTASQNTFTITDAATFLATHGSDFIGGKAYFNEGTNATTDGYEITEINSETVHLSGNPGPLTTTVENTQSGYLAPPASYYTGNGGSPLVLNEIYAKTQYQLRQTSDINEYYKSNVNVIGNIADELIYFTGSLLTASGNTATPFPASYNPEKGTDSGVIIEGLNLNDINSVTFYDDNGVPRKFPFTATGTIDFNNNLENETTNDTQFYMFFEYTRQRSATGASLTLNATARSANINIASTGNANTDFTKDGTSFLPQLANNYYVKVAGFTNPENNGIYRITNDSSATVLTVFKAEGDAPVAEAGPVAITVDESPIDSPSAIVVEDVNSANIAGTATSDFAWTFDYEGNNQGSRFPADVNGTNDASVIVRAIGLNVAQFAESTPFSITKATNQTITVTSALERNYLNAP